MEHTIDRSARFWDKVAAKYAKKPIADQAAYERKLDVTRARLRPTDTLLDIGCGTGSLALELAPLVKEAHAVDVSAEMIKIANRKANDAGVQNVTFYAGTLAQQSTFAPESFDVICVYNLLHLLEDPNAMLRDVFALLRPGGTFISSSACLRESWVPFGLFLPLMQAIGKAPFVKFFRWSELESGIASAGFIDINRMPVTKNKMTAFVVCTKPEAKLSVP